MSVSVRALLQRRERPAVSPPSFRFALGRCLGGTWILLSGTSVWRPGFCSVCRSGTGSSESWLCSQHSCRGRWPPRERTCIRRGAQHWMNMRCVRVRVWRMICWDNRSESTDCERGASMHANLVPRQRHDRRRTRVVAYTYRGCVIRSVCESFGVLTDLPWEKRGSANSS